MTKAQELQLMIRHPNNSGLQRDPLTQYFIPAHFVQNLSISQGDRLILSMEGGISISEDPNFRFDFAVHGTDEIRVEAVDTDGKVFSDKWPLDGRPEGGSLDPFFMHSTDAIRYSRSSVCRPQPGLAEFGSRPPWPARSHGTGRSPRPSSAPCGGRFRPCT